MDGEVMLLQHCTTFIGGVPQATDLGKASRETIQLSKMSQEEGTRRGPRCLANRRTQL